MQILQHIPVWVFFLLLGLIALGLQQTRTRHIPKPRLLGINIALTVFTLVGVIQQWSPTPWLALGLLSWAASCALVAWGLGRGAAPAGASYDAETRRLSATGNTVADLTQVASEEVISKLVRQTLSQMGFDLSDVEQAVKPGLDESEQQGAQGGGDNG